MRFLGKFGDSFSIRISEYEHHVIASALGQVGQGMAQPAPDLFECRLGGPTEAVGALRSRFENLETLPDAGLRELPIIKARSELLLLVRVLDELANGVALADWEFAIIVGHSRNDVRDLPHALHQLLVRFGRDLDELKPGEERRSTEK